MLERDCDLNFCECSEDGKHLLIHDTHEGCNVCRKCGIVVGAVTNDTPEWFEPERARASCDAFTTVGKPTSLMNKMNMSINQKNMCERFLPSFITLGQKFNHELNRIFWFTDCKILH